jgi:hypothetical protein
MPATTARAEETTPPPADGRRTDQAAAPRGLSQVWTLFSSPGLMSLGGVSPVAGSGSWSPLQQHPHVRLALPCLAKRTNGEPCRAYAITGGTVCRAHGGAAPQVRAAAHRRIILSQITAGLLAGQAKAARRRDPLGDFDFRYGPRTYRSPG